MCNFISSFSSSRRIKRDSNYIYTHENQPLNRAYKSGVKKKILKDSLVFPSMCIARDWQ